MLGSTILGFHTRFHCKNFIETVDRYLEARIEHEYSSISYQDKETLIESYPISIEWPTARADARPGRRWPNAGAAYSSASICRADTCLAVGVDRFDYTKGILERLRAVQSLLEKRPEWRGRFVFVQVAAPTRSELDEYRSLRERIQRVSDRINQRFGSEHYQPVHLLVEHHERDALNELFRAANMCVVTSLHDGMNLVSKEFVAARDDEQGVLILSRFAGAARELTEALIVNPYHVEESADALHRAATMPAAEQRERMGALRMTVREYNVYRWAGPHAGRRRALAHARAHRGARAALHATMRAMRHLFTPRRRRRSGLGDGAPAAVGLRLRRHAGADRRAAVAGAGAGHHAAAAAPTDAAAAAGRDLGPHGGRPAAPPRLRAGARRGQPRRGGSATRAAAGVAGGARWRARSAALGRRRAATGRRQRRRQGRIAGAALPHWPPIVVRRSS